MEQLNKENIQVSNANQVMQSPSNDAVRCIAVTGGKGGVGKTNISVNLATNLSKLNRRVVLLDADLGLANVDVVLGLSPKKNLSHVIENQCELEEVLLDGPEGIRIIPASSGVKRMANLNNLEQSGLISAFNSISDQLDIMIIDTAAGINESVINFSRAAGEVVVVVCDEPASIADAYALIKVLSRDYAVNKVHMICNQVESKAHGEVLLNQMMKVINKYLDVSVNYLGSIPEDSYLRKAVKRQVVVSSAYPRCRASEAFRELAKKLINTKNSSQSTGNLEFFVEKLVGYNTH